MSILKSLGKFAGGLLMPDSAAGKVGKAGGILSMLGLGGGSQAQPAPGQTPPITPPAGGQPQAPIDPKQAFADKMGKAGDLFAAGSQLMQAGAPQGPAAAPGMDLQTRLMQQQGMWGQPRNAWGARR